MNRGHNTSPLHAKAKRRQSDAKWRASVATCYDALKYVVPNVKAMTKRKISKALILQESEKHIQELEAAVHHLLEVESKRKGKTVLWKDSAQWSHCTLDKLKIDFSEKQQRVFHMAAHGRRCYNLLQDIKEEVFAMEADAAQLAVVPDTVQLPPSPSVTPAVSTNVGERGNCELKKSQEVQPICRISLFVSGISDPMRQQKQSIAASISKQDYEQSNSRQLFHQGELNSPLGESSLYDSSHLKEPFTCITSKKQSVPSSSCEVSTYAGGKTTGSSVIRLKVERQSPLSFLETSRQGIPTPSTGTDSLPLPFYSVPLCPSLSLPTSSNHPNEQCEIDPQPSSEGHNFLVLGPNASQSAIYTDGNVFRNVGSHHDGGNKMCYPFTDSLSKTHIDSHHYNLDSMRNYSSTSNDNSTSLSNTRYNADVVHDTQRLKFSIENVDGDLYIMSDGNSSMARLIRLSPSLIKNRQEVPLSMKVPVKLPQETKLLPQDTRTTQTYIKETSIDDQHTELRETTITSPCGEAHEIDSRDLTIQEETGATVSESSADLFPVNGVSAPSQVFTPRQRNKDLMHVSDIKVESSERHTPQINQDPLLSSLVTPKLDAVTPLFMRTENDMIIKRRPRLGTAKKRLNFGQCQNMKTPDKCEIPATLRSQTSGGGFTPVKLPDEFSLVPQSDGTSLTSIVSPWKIIDSPSFEPRIVPQKFLDSSPILDLHDSLLCMETMDTMDLSSDEDDTVTSVEKVKALHLEETLKTKRHISPNPSEASCRPKPKCRRKLDRFYDDPSSFRDGHSVETLSDTDNIHTVPDITLQCNRDIQIFNEAYGLDQDKSKVDEKINIQNLKPSNMDFECKEEESHIVPDMDVELNKLKGQASVKLEDLGLTCSTVTMGNECEDFDGFFFYYRHMSQQLRQSNGKKIPQTYERG